MLVKNNAITLPAWQPNTNANSYQSLLEISQTQFSTLSTFESNYRCFEHYAPYKFSFNLYLLTSKKNQLMQ